MLRFVQVIAGSFLHLSSRAIVPRLRLCAEPEQLFGVDAGLGVRMRSPAQGAHSLTGEHLGRIPVDFRLLIPKMLTLRGMSIFAEHLRGWSILGGEGPFPRPAERRLAGLDLSRTAHAHAPACSCTVIRTRFTVGARSFGQSKTDPRRPRLRQPRTVRGEPTLIDSTRPPEMGRFNFWGP